MILLLIIYYINLMSWQENINTIKEIFPGHYQIILDFATNAFLDYILDERYKYIWVVNHRVSDYLTWQQHNLPLFENQNSYNILSRHITFDFAVPTQEFKKLIPKLNPGIKLIQLNKLPKYYIDPIKIKGQSLYKLLHEECDYLFEIDIPSATDYGTLISPDKKWLQSLLDNSEINWNDLP